MERKITTEWSFIDPNTVERRDETTPDVFILRVQLYGGKIYGRSYRPNHPDMMFQIDPPLEAVKMLLRAPVSPPVHIVTQNMTNDTYHLPDTYFVTENVTVGDLRKAMANV